MCRGADFNDSLLFDKDARLFEQGFARKYSGIDVRCLHGAKVGRSDESDDARHWHMEKSGAKHSEPRSQIFGIWASHVASMEHEQKPNDRDLTFF